jgi:hypothetical protein
VFVSCGCAVGVHYVTKDEVDLETTMADTAHRIAKGWLLEVMGVAMLLPVLVEWLAYGVVRSAGVWMIASGSVLIGWGTATLVTGYQRQARLSLPRGVRAAVFANGVILTFCALEFSDRLVRQEGRIFYWNLFLTPPALVLFWGLTTARSWAWWTCRAGTALGVCLFLGFACLIPFGNLRTDGVPVPWDGQLYMITVSLGFASTLAAAFWEIGRKEGRSHFGLMPVQPDRA